VRWRRTFPVENSHVQRPRGSSKWKEVGRIKQSTAAEAGGGRDQILPKWAWIQKVLLLTCKQFTILEPWFPHL
jgi:hypothetical protein